MAGNTDPFGAMQRTINALQAEVDALRAQQPQYAARIFSGDRNWEDVAHGVSLALYAVRREHETHGQPRHVEATLGRLLEAIKSGDRIEFHANGKWRWLNLEEKHAAERSSDS